MTECGEHECPPELEYLWNWFLDLNHSRVCTTAANGIPYLEIEAFERAHLLTLTAWEKSVLRRCDMGATAALNKRLSNPKGADKGIPKQNGGAIADGLRALAAAKNNKK